MRRSVVIYLSAALAALLLAAVFSWTENQKISRRYHQHQVQPGEVELGTCEVCNGLAPLCTHLPIIRIETDGQYIPGRPITDEMGIITGYEMSEDGDEYILVTVSFVDGKGIWHHSDDTPNYASSALFRIRGNTSRWFDKPNYRIKLTKDNQPEVDNNLPLLGMTSGSEWSLHGPFLDKTLLRNYVGMNMSAEVMGYAPNVRFCEVLLDGEYQGVYLLMETINVQEGRVSMTKYNAGDTIASYLVRLDYNVGPEKLIEGFSAYTHRLELNTDMEIVYPGLLNQNENVRSFIKADISEIEKSLYSLEIIKDSSSYKNLIDVNSFVDFYILNEFLAINDVFTASTFFYRDIRGKLTIGPVWDFNNALDNYIRPLPMNQFHLSQRGWFGRLMMDKEFVEKVIHRYRELRSNILSEKRLLRYITDSELWLGSAVDRNFDVWGYSFSPDLLTQYTRRRPNTGDEQTIYDLNPSNYSEAVEEMIENIIRRGQWMDENIESLRQYCHPSRKAIWSLE